APFFRSLAANSSDYIAAMRRVANRFSIKQMYAQAAGALREVLGAAVSDEEALDSARKLYDNIIRGKVLDHAAVDVERIGRVSEQRLYDHRVAKDKRDKIAVELEASARDIATRAHLLAKESSGKGDRTAALQGEAADAYTAFLAWFPASKARLEMEQNR